MTNKTPTLSLVMIVKNEEHIISECLNSVYKEIDRYDITDTGSSDNTIQIIKDFFQEKGIPGEVYESDWKGFGKSRTESLRNADKGGADYSWVIDADDRLEGNLGWKNRPPEKSGRYFRFPENSPSSDRASHSIDVIAGTFWRGPNEGNERGELDDAPLE